jgi:hypothetical protein
MPIELLCATIPTIFPGVISRVLIFSCEISQFWQKLHFNVHPFGPVEKIEEPG